MCSLLPFHVTHARSVGAHIFCGHYAFAHYANEKWLIVITFLWTLSFRFWPTSQVAIVQRARFRSTKCILSETHLYDWLMNRVGTFHWKAIAHFPNTFKVRQKSSANFQKFYITWTSNFIFDRVSSTFLRHRAREVGFNSCFKQG